MSWYDENYKRRIPIVVDGSGHTGANAQVVFNVPSDYDDFWENIRSDGNDIVVTDKSGDTKVVFEKGFVFSTRTLSIKVFQILTDEESSMHVIYLYWDFETETTDHGTSVTIVSSLNGYIYLGAPFGNVVNFQSRSGLSTVPTTIFQKDPDEEIDVWFPASQLLAPRSLPFNERLDFKGISSTKVEVLDSTPTNQTAMFTLGDTRVINGWIRYRIKAGSDNTDYVIRSIVVTTDSEKLIQSALLQVRKLLPS